MGSELATRQSNLAATTDGDNRYRSVQDKLGLLIKAMDAAGSELEQLRRRVQANGDRAGAVAGSIAHARLEGKFIEMTAAVGELLGAAIKTGQQLDEQARDVSSSAQGAKSTHSRLYGELDEVRSGRRERTPSPGFFAH